MWNRRKEEEPAPKPTSVTPTVSQPVKEGIPMSTQPTRPLEARPEPARGGVAILGKSVILKGQIYGREDVTIDGEVEGTVELQEHRLTVGPTGKVVATIKAREIVVLGTVQGNIETREKIEIRKDAKVSGRHSHCPYRDRGRRLLQGQHRHCSRRSAQASGSTRGAEAAASGLGRHVLSGCCRERG